jgi:hypothetical protein
MSKSCEKVADSLDCLRRLKAILISEGESNWVRGLQATIQAGESIQDSNMAMKEMSSIYRSMHGGAGSFSDYFIWRDDLGVS